MRSKGVMMAEPTNPQLETLECIDARLVELDLLEQALNDEHDMDKFKLQRLADLNRRRKALIKKSKQANYIIIDLASKYELPTEYHDALWQAYAEGCKRGFIDAIIKLS